MSWFTLPNFIGWKIQELDSKDYYHLFEGFGISNHGQDFEVKLNGAYAKIKMDNEQDYHKLLRYIGCDKWWEKYERNRSWFSLGHWREK